MHLYDSMSNDNEQIRKETDAANTTFLDVQESAASGNFGRLQAKLTIAFHPWIYPTSLATLIPIRAKHTCPFLAGILDARFRESVVAPTLRAHQGHLAVCCLKSVLGGWDTSRGMRFWL